MKKTVFYATIDTQGTEQLLRDLSRRDYCDVLVVAPAYRLAKSPVEKFSGGANLRKDIDQVVYQDKTMRVVARPMGDGSRLLADIDEFDVVVFANVLQAPRDTVLRVADAAAAPSPEIRYAASAELTEQQKATILGLVDQVVAEQTAKRFPRLADGTTP